MGSDLTGRVEWYLAWDWFLFDSQMAAKQKIFDQIYCMIFAEDGL